MIEIPETVDYSEMGDIFSIDLERLQMTANVIISERECFNDPEIFIRLLPEKVKQLVMVMTAHVWAEHLQSEEETVEYPLTWWDHFKRDAIPTFTKWFGLKWEMEITTITFERKAYFPKFIHHVDGKIFRFYEQTRRENATRI